MSEQTARDLGIRAAVAALACALACAAYTLLAAPSAVERLAPEGAGPELVAALEDGWRPGGGK